MAAGSATPATSSPFPEGDPRNATYFQNLAALEHQYNTTLAGDEEALRGAKTNAEYQTNLLAKQEPIGLESLRSRANSEGLLHSGVLAVRAGALQSSYAAKRFAVTSKLQDTEGKVQRLEQGARARREGTEATDTQKALSENYNSLLKEQPNEQASSSSTTTPSARLPAVKAQRAQPTTAGIRRAAANRYRNLNVVRT